MTGKKLKDFYNKLGDVYPEEKYVHRSSWGKSRRRFLKLKLQKYFKKSAVFVDIGCGGGIYLKLLEKFGAEKIFGLDISYPALLRAKILCKSASLICADAEIIPIKSDSADFILSSETVEHLENPEKLFGEVSRILNDDGIFIITCPNWHGEKPKEIDVGILKNFGIADGKYIHTAYTPLELENFAKKVGLRTIESGTFEKDMRIFGRIYDALWNIVFNLLKKFASDKLIRFAYNSQSLVSGIIYDILRFCGIAFIMRKIFRRGPRSFLIAEKIMEKSQ